MNKLSELSTDELLKRAEELELKKEIKLDNKLKKLGRRNIKVYEPHEKQRLAHECDALVRIIHGGNDSGKSVWGAVESVWWATKTHPFKKWVNEYEGPMHIFIVVRDHQQQTRPGGPQDNLLKWLPKESIEKTTYIRGNIIESIRLKNKSTFNFFSSLSSREAAQGARYTAIWIDEECIKDASFWNELVTRVEAGRRLYIWMTATPELSGEPSWMEDAIYKDANRPSSKIRLFVFSLYDNPHVLEESKSDIADLLQGDEAEINARLFGTRQVRGKIYEKFSKRVHVIPPIKDEELMRMRGIWRIIDPHEAKPICVLFCGVTPSGDFVIFEELKQDALVSQVADTMNRIAYGFKHLLVRDIMDYIGRKKSRVEEGKSIADEFRDNGIYVHSSVKDVFGGIALVKKILYHDEEIRARLYVCSNCTNTIEEFGKYRWGKDRKPVKEWDDFMDCIRYLVCDPSVKPFLKMDTNRAQSKLSKNVEDLTIRNQNKSSKMKRRLEMIGAGVGR